MTGLEARVRGPQPRPTEQPGLSLQPPAVLSGPLRAHSGPFRLHGLSGLQGPALGLGCGQPQDKGPRTLRRQHGPCLTLSVTDNRLSLPSASHLPIKSRRRRRNPGPDSEVARPRSWSQEMSDTRKARLGIGHRMHWGRWDSLVQHHSSQPAGQQGAMGACAPARPRAVLLRSQEHVAGQEPRSGL